MHLCAAHGAMRAPAEFHLQPPTSSVRSRGTCRLRYSHPLCKLRVNMCALVHCQPQPPTALRSTLLKPSNIWYNLLNLHDDTPCSPVHTPLQPRILTFSAPHVRTCSSCRLYTRATSCVYPEILVPLRAHACCRTEVHLATPFRYPHNPPFAHLQPQYQHTRTPVPPHMCRSAFPITRASLWPHTGTPQAPCARCTHLQPHISTPYNSTYTPLQPKVRTPAAPQKPTHTSAPIPTLLHLYVCTPAALQYTPEVPATCACVQPLAHTPQPLCVRCTRLLSHMHLPCKPVYIYLQSNVHTSTGSHVHTRSL